MDYVIPATTQIQPESTEISDRWQGKTYDSPAPCALAVAARCFHGCRP